ncbi:MAG: carbon-nitrogen hydrolase family protein [Anaerolineales bacterium]|nr:carbon-nitrogen hydrolase family protein [Anaerolineales bacterium]
MILSALIAQFPISISIRHNLKTILDIAKQAEPGQLVFFPEGALCGYSLDLSFLENLDQQELQEGLTVLQAAAIQRKINLWVGACVFENGNWYNQAFGFTPDGRRLHYRKINLANHERGVFTAGSELPVFQLENLIGIQLCREMRYPEQWGWLARQGVQIFLHLNNAAGHDLPRPVWRSHLISRAAETQRFVLSTNIAAAKQLCPTMTIAPDG